jgi:5-methylcytosine-specific restriction endonuclease McrA
MATGITTLVLNGDYNPITMLPIETIPAEDAVTRVLNGTCHVVTEYDRFIRTPKLVMKWPSIIARDEMDWIPVHAKLHQENLYYRDHGLCAYCGVPLGNYKRVTEDHVHPKSKGGTNGWDNIVAACYRCNHTKGNNLPKGIWKPKYAKPYIPSYWQLVEAYKTFPLIIPDIGWMDFLGKWGGEVTVHNNYA